MSFTGNNPKFKTITYTPQSADPASPAEGMIFRADGTSRAAGLWQYLSSKWVSLDATLGSVTAKSADYVILDTDGIGTVLMTTAGTNRTVTLPTAADNVNRIISVKKVDSGTGHVSLATEGTEDLDGAASKRIANQYETLTCVSDGSDWYIISRYFSVEADETWTDSEANSTTAVRVIRTQNRVKVIGTVTVTGAFAGSNFAVTIPAKYTIDTASYVGDLTNTRPIIGQANLFDANGANVLGFVYIRSSTEIRIGYHGVSGATIVQTNVASTAPFTWANGDFIHFVAEWVVDQWE